MQCIGCCGVGFEVAARGLSMNYFKEWLKTTPEYQTLVFQHGEHLFVQRDGEFEILTVRLAYRVWCELKNQRGASD